MRSLTPPVLGLLLFCHVTASHATTYTITSAAGFSSLPSTLYGGDEIVISNGTYANVGRTLNAAGTTNNPVRMYAANPGSVFFSGGTQFVLRGTNMVISGLAFDGDHAAGGPKYASGIFRFDTWSWGYTLRDCLFRNFDTGSPSSGAYWIQMNGFHHTVEYCSFIGKSAEDQVITINPTDSESGTESIPRQHLLRYCYFADRTNISTNGYETIQIGESAYQMYNMSTIVEYCLFKRAIYGDDVSVYEPEVISSKSRNNVFRYNTFVENKGGLVLRHGDDCVVDGNFFFGESNSTMGAGIRISGLRHIIRNNYLQDVDGSDLRAAICLMKGSGEWPDNSTSSGYESPGSARIFHNTIVNCNQPFGLGVTTGSSGTTPPNNVEIRNNVVQSETNDGPVIYFNSDNGWSISQITFSGNQAYHPSGTYGTVPASGVTTGTPVNLTLDGSLGYMIPQAGSPVSNAVAATTPATVNDIRSMLRSGPPYDAGCYDSEATGTSFNKPLAKADVGPVFDGRTDTNRAPTLLSQPVALSVYEGDPVTNSVTAESDLAISYQWRRNEIPIAGATNSMFVLTSAALADAGTYTVAVANSSGRTISFPAVLTVAPAAPVITTQPSPQLVSVGGSATFSVAAAGLPPFSYQWRKDAAPITWGTNSSLIVTNVQAADVGNYSVVVSNAYGTATSQDASLSIVGGTILLNDGFDDGMRTNQSLPGSAKWYASSSSYPLTVSAGALTVPAGGHALAFFKDSGVDSLAVGEQLTVTFTLNFSTVGTSAGGFRFGFFNSNGTARPPDPNNTTFTNYDGYIVTTTAKYPDSNTNSAGPITFRQRNPGVAGTLISTVGSGIYSDVAASPSTSQSFVAGINYTVTFTVARTATGTVNLFMAVSGGSLSNYTFTANDVSGIVTGFDGFAVLSTSSNGSTYSIDNVTVVHSTIPAPSAIFSASPTAGPAPLLVGFTDNSTGTMTSVAWDFGDGGTTNFTVPTSVQYVYATPGVYTVTLINSNPSGAATNTQSNLITVTGVDPYTTWASNYFGCTICPEAQADADPLGKGISNTNQFLLGLNPTNPASVFRITSVVRDGSNNVVITWSAAGVRTNAVQATSGGANGSYATNFVDITASPHVIISVDGDATTNYVDVGGATNTPARYYRIRLVP